MKIFFSMFMIALITLPVSAQTDDAIDFFGQVRVRAEIDGRDFNNDTYPTTFTVMRTRLGAKKSFEKKVDIKVVLQDSRFFGEEQDTRAAIDNLDLHEAFVKLNHPLGLPLSVQAGRFEMPYGNQRLIAKNNWHNVGRSFDGIKFQLPIGTETNLWFTTVRNRILRGSFPGAPFNAPADSSLRFCGIWSTFEPAEKQLLDFFAYRELDNGKINGIDDDLDRYTLGFMYRGNLKGWQPAFEFAYQLGSRSAMDISAYMLAPQLYYKFSKVKTGIGATIFSGTEIGATEINTFSNNLGAGHKYYGYMDYFSANIAGQTQGSGLMNFYYHLLWTPDKSPFSLQVDLHHFMSSQANAADESVFGQELDIVLKYQFIESTCINWFSGIFLPGDLMKTFYNTPMGQREDPGFWSAIMVIADF
jgi:hypothetical protein